jgi:hypothetical protein
MKAAAMKAAAMKAAAVEAAAMEAATVEAAAMGPASVEAAAAMAAVALRRRAQGDGDERSPREGRQYGFRKAFQMDLHFLEAVGHYDRRSKSPIPRRQR